MDRSDLQLVHHLRTLGSLAATAAELHVTPSVVSKRLARLEGELGLRLFLRTTRRLAPTPEGERLGDGAAQLLAQFGALERDMQERHQEPVGLIRLAATFGFGRQWLGPALADFQQRHARVQIQLQLTDQLPDLASEGYDGAIWLWPPQANRHHEWSARRLARNRRVLVAAPAYLERRGVPAALEELPAHDCLVVRENRQSDTWTLHAEREDGQPAAPAGPAHSLRVRGALSSNSGELVRDWCLAGRGIMLRSLWDVARHLRSGELVRVLPPYAMPDADIHWLAPYQPRVPRRLALLADFLHQRFAAEPWLEPAGRPGA